MKNYPDGTFDIKEIFEKVRADDPHFPISRLVCIENSHNKCGGKAVPVQWVDQVGQVCKDLGLKLHCDGARLFNTAAALGVSAESLVRPCDTVSICLSKGLGAPVGSCIAGPKDFIRRAIRVRKSLGGGMRQAGILAAAGIFAIDKKIPKLQRDNEIATNLAKGERMLG